MAANGREALRLYKAFLYLNIFLTRCISANDGVPACCRGGVGYESRFLFNFCQVIKKIQIHVISMRKTAHLKKIGY